MGLTTYKVGVAKFLCNNVRRHLRTSMQNLVDSFLPTYVFYMEKAEQLSCIFLPARASEQGNVIGLVSVYIYIYMSSKKNCN